MGEKENEQEEFIHAIRKFMEMRTLTKQVGAVKIYAQNCLQAPAE